jgi:hypothetical protein
MSEKCSECGGFFTGDHAQVGLTGEYGDHAHIDEGIAPLVQACWALGIGTSGTCQGGGEVKVALGFAPGGAQRFARAATLARTPVEMEQNPEEALDWRIYEFRDYDDPAGWRWIPGYPWDPGFTVYFPPSDLYEVTRRLQALVEASR